jgi:hypothetical protein
MALRSEELIDKDVINIRKCLPEECLLVQQGNVTLKFIVGLSVRI